MNGRLIGVGAMAGLLLSSVTWAEMGGKSGGTEPTGKHQPGSLDMTATSEATPSEYAILPLARGQKQEVGGHELVGDEIKGKNGQKIGTLDKLIMDTRTGKIEYGVVKFSDTNEIWPINWNAFKVNRETGRVSLNLTRDELMKGKTTLDEAKDLSPDIKSLVQDMRKSMGEPKVHQEGLGVTKQPASAGGQGEEEVGGAGPSGTRGLPPGEAPSFKDEASKSQ